VEQAPVTLFNIAVSLAAFLGAWMLNRLHGDIQNAQGKLQALTVHLPESYVKKDDYREDMKAIKSDLRDILEELRNKKDKHE
jgi:predicted RNA-binding protein with EMAP domain